VAKHLFVGRELVAARICGAGLRVTATATTVRTVNGKQAIHDGPFAESREQLGGFDLIDVPSLDAAIGFQKDSRSAAQ
jgi:hypothetical protein